MLDETASRLFAELYAAQIPDRRAGLARALRQVSSQMAARSATRSGMARTAIRDVYAAEMKARGALAWEKLQEVLSQLGFEPTDSSIHDISTVLAVAVDAQYEELSPQLDRDLAATGKPGKSGIGEDLASVKRELSGTCDGGSVNCLITGLTATSTAGGNDVDGGLTSIQSPPIVLPAGGTITLRFRFFFAHLNNATSADLFRVRVLGSNGVAQTVAARGGTASNVAGAWTTRTANISAWAGQTIQLRVEALDANPGSLIEAGVDNVTIIRQ